MRAAGLTVCRNYGRTATFNGEELRNTVLWRCDSVPYCKASMLVDSPAAFKDEENEDLALSRSRSKQSLSSRIPKRVPKHLVGGAWRHSPLGIDSLSKGSLRWKEGLPRYSARTEQLPSARLPKRLSRPMPSLSCLAVCHSTLAKNQWKKQTPKTPQMLRDMTSIRLFMSTELEHREDSASSMLQAD